MRSSTTSSTAAFFTPGSALPRTAISLRHSQDAASNTSNLGSQSRLNKYSMNTLNDSLAIASASITDAEVVEEEDPPVAVCFICMNGHLLASPSLRACGATVTFTTGLSGDGGGESRPATSASSEYTAYISSSTLARAISPTREGGGHALTTLWKSASMSRYRS